MNNEVTDISPLASLTNLSRLDLTGNEISDLSPLASLTNLTKLTLTGNEISDLSPLSALTGLTGSTSRRTRWRRALVVPSSKPGNAGWREAAAAVCNDFDDMGGRGEMRKAPIELRSDLRRKIYAAEGEG